MVAARLHQGLVSLLDEDPDLAAGIAEGELDAARRQSIVGVIDVRPPAWDPAALGGEPVGGWLGLMVLEGLLLRRVQAVTQLPRTHARLLVLFWLLAERWGTVNPRGISVALPITHDVLAMLVGVRRPTVTLALQRLSRAKLVICERSDRWLLTQQAMELLDDPDRLELVETAGSDEEPARGGSPLVLPLTRPVSPP